MKTSTNIFDTLNFKFHNMVDWIFIFSPVKELNFNLDKLEVSRFKRGWIHITYSSLSQKTDEVALD